MSLGLIPSVSGASPSCEPSPQYLLDNLPRSPRLNAASYPYTEVLQIQLERLAVDALCNPFCALNDAKDGFLFTIPDARREILAEIWSVVLSLPELRSVPGVRERFAVDRVEDAVNAILTKTAKGTCSMVGDLRTEVRFINGY
jgi:2-dehydropantoate 2-reductase